MNSAPIALFRRSLNADVAGPFGAVGLLVLRAGVGLMIAYVHGWHKLLGGLAYLRDGTPWPLVVEVAEMHVPFPVVSAFLATLVQLVCAPLLMIGLATRLNAALLTGTLGVAILQNLLAGRDPQLALLYTLAVVTLAITGGGKFSLDAGLARRYDRDPS